MIKQAALPLTALLLSANGDARPVVLVVAPVSDGVELRVVGHAATAVEARFSLEVKGGGNTSVQRGVARLTPDQSATLVHLKLGPSAREDWQARLLVDLDSGGSYQQLEQARVAR